MKLVLGISIITGLNYFNLINVSDYSASAASVSAAITCYLCSASAPLTTAAALLLLLLLTTASLPLSAADRVSACQMAGIRAFVWFTKPVLEEQKKKKKKKKKKKEKKRKKRKKKKKREKKKEKENYNNNENDDDNKNDDNNNDNELAI
ncbi:hypothetical protein CISG_10068 [Coccidioides immitis RMSCC 3703]|uniref:Uncharacterized protein n=1 Tax=Coccidioides immitis RMSCC 3703 TaxID=454286 RepID=A0A0J8QPS7_COCIT|nr:hypothetical protein CISG_10068 [Coccidioides immitis RMSCC 3703]